MGRKMPTFSALAHSCLGENVASLLGQMRQSFGQKRNPAELKDVKAHLNLSRIRRDQCWGILSLGAG
jgi:hypothetical protein